MKGIFLATLLGISVMSFAPIDDCKMIDFVDPVTRETTKVVPTLTTKGRLLVGKSKSGYMIGYLSNNFTSYQSNPDLIDIFTVKYTFEGSTTITLRGRGVAKLPNRIQLKAELSDIGFVTFLSSKEAEIFKTKHLVSFHIEDKKQRHAGDLLPGQNQNYLKSSFNYQNQ